METLSRQFLPLLFGGMFLGVTTWTKMSTMACLSGVIHKHHAKYYTNITRIHLNYSSGLYNCLEACDNDINCTSVLVEKLDSTQSGINCYIQNGMGNLTLKSGPDVQVLYKRQKIVRKVGRETREACLPCSSDLSGPRRGMACSVGDNKERSETQPVPNGGDSPGPPASNTNSTSSEEGAVSALGPPAGGNTNSTDSEEWATSVLGPTTTNTNRTNIRVGAASAPGPPAGSTKTTEGERDAVEPSFSDTLRTNTRDGAGSVSHLPRASITNLTNIITNDNSTNSTNLHNSMDSLNTSTDSSEVVDSTVSNSNETVVSPRMTFDATIGSCPPPFHPLPELAHGCYYIPDDFENKKKTFEDAEKSCQSLHDLSHLIHTETKEVSHLLLYYSGEVQAKNNPPWNISKCNYFNILGGPPLRQELYSQSQWLYGQTVRQTDIQTEHYNFSLIHLYWYVNQGLS